MDDTLYADDPDVHVIYPVTDASGGPLTFAAVVRVAGHADIPATWTGATAPHPTTPGATVRDLRVPLAGLPAGLVHGLRLIIDADNDVFLGNVVLV